MAFTIPFVTGVGAKVGSAVGLGMQSLAVTNTIGAATIGAGGFLASKAIKSLTSTPKLPNVSTQALPPTPTFEKAQEESREDVLRDLRRKRTGTVLTSPLGLLNEGDTSKKTLLGG